MLHNKRVRTLTIFAGLACAAVLALLIVPRVLAMQTLLVPSPYVFTVNAHTSKAVTLPLDTPVSISISETGGGSSGTATIVAICTWGQWGWIGLNVNGTVAKGGGVTMIGTLMCLSALGQTVKVNNLSGGILFGNTNVYPMRAYIHY
jgi:hypothetical protein